VDGGEWWGECWSAGWRSAGWWFGSCVTWLWRGRPRLRSLHVLRRHWSSSSGPRLWGKRRLPGGRLMGPVRASGPSRRSGGGAEGDLGRAQAVAAAVGRGCRGGREVTPRPGMKRGSANSYWNHLSDGDPSGTSARTFTCSRESSPGPASWGEETLRTPGMEHWRAAQRRRRHDEAVQCAQERGVDLPVFEKAA